MKKKYTAPEVKIITVDLAGIICVSAGVGDGETDTMWSNERDNFSEEDSFWKK